MPEMSGSQFLEKAKKIFPDAIRILMTGYSDLEAIIDAVNRGEIHRYVTKPWKDDEVVLQVREALGQYELVLENKRLLGLTRDQNRELRELNKYLEERVAERTAELRRAYSRLELLDEEKMTFLTYLSHEMNTALNWIGATAVMDSDRLSDEDKEIVEIVEKGFERLNNLTKAVLSYFGLAAGDLNLTLTDISLKEFLYDIVTKENEMARAAGAKIITMIEEDRSIQVDTVYFNELLRILFDNAIAFSEPSGTITVKADIEGRKVRLTIADKGRGIDKQDLENIFKPFSTEEFNRREGGYGLNLPKARIIAEAHGWNLWAESQGKGYGAQFVLEKNPYESIVDTKHQ
jgi:signal transduction histidine kinase